MVSVKLGQHVLTVLNHIFFLFLLQPNHSSTNICCYFTVPRHLFCVHYNLFHFHILHQCCCHFKFLTLIPLHSYHVCFSLCFWFCLYFVPGNTGLESNTNEVNKAGAAVLVVWAHAVLGERNAGCCHWTFYWGSISRDREVKHELCGF